MKAFGNRIAEAVTDRRSADPENVLTFIHTIVMETNIKAIHFDITDKLIAFVEKKIDRLARRYECISDADVNLRLVKPETSLNKEAGIKVTVPQAGEFFASKTADTFEEAVDLSIDALEKQLEKNKEKNAR